MLALIAVHTYRVPYLETNQNIDELSCPGCLSEIEISCMKLSVLSEIRPESGNKNRYAYQRSMMLTSFETILVVLLLSTCRGV